MFVWAHIDVIKLITRLKFQRAERRYEVYDAPDKPGWISSGQRFYLSDLGSHGMGFGMGGKWAKAGVAAKAHASCNSLH